MKQINLFETSVFVRSCDRHHDIKSYVDQNILPSYEQSQGDQQNDQNGLSNVYSDFFEGAIKADQNLLSQLYAPDIRALMSHVGFSSDIDWQIRPYFWYNITEKGGSQDAHCHITGPQSVTFCAIHYVEFDPSEHSSAFFTNPQEQIIRSTHPSEDPNKIPEHFKQLFKAPKIQQGEIVFFPPWLKHTVTKQTSSKRRISIAMNLSIFERK